MTVDEADLIERKIETLLREHPPSAVDDRQFWSAQFDLGLAWVHHPPGLGGLGAGSHWQHVIDAKIADAGGSLANRDANVVGIGMAAPTLLAFAEPDLQRRLLRPIFTAEEVWCQLFSEPGAGSDLAGLATSARRVDGGWLVEGQKVWTTLAHVARWGLLVTRSDPEVPKHRGLTFFILDMQSNGVEVRPLYEMTGEAEFNEVFLDSVLVPDENRLGDAGRGWDVVLTTLMSERVAAGSGVGGSSVPIAQAVERWIAAGSDPAHRDRLMRLWVRAEALRLSEARAAEATLAGRPGPEGSLLKLNWAELNKDVTAFLVGVQGGSGMLHLAGYEFHRPVSSSVRVTDPSKAFLRARANSIEGGTSEIMRNVLAERVLRLPSASRTDRDLPWRDVPRN